MTGKNKTVKIKLWSDFPEYVCPHCGSHDIECDAFCTVALSQDEEGNKYAEILSIDGIDEDATCECSNPACRAIIGRLWRCRTD